jgi:hypothetical protein
LPAAGRGNDVELTLNAVEQLVVGVAERLHALALQCEGHCVEVNPCAVGVSERLRRMWLGVERTDHLAVVGDGPCPSSQSARARAPSRAASHRAANCKPGAPGKTRAQSREESREEVWQASKASHKKTPRLRDCSGRCLWVRAWWWRKPWLVFGKSREGVDCVAALLSAGADVGA